MYNGVRVLTISFLSGWRKEIEPPLLFVMLRITEEDFEWEARDYLSQITDVERFAKRYQACN